MYCGLDALDPLKWQVGGSRVWREDWCTGRRGSMSSKECGCLPSCQASLHSYLLTLQHGSCNIGHLMAAAACRGGLLVWPPTRTASTVVQNTEVGEVAWMFWILLILLLVSRAAFVVSGRLRCCCCEADGQCTQCTQPLCAPAAPVRAS